MRSFFSNLFAKKQRPIPTAELFTASDDELSQLQEIARETTQPVVIHEADLFQKGYQDGLYFNDQTYLETQLANLLENHMLRVERKLHQTEDLKQQLLDIRGICERQQRYDHVAEIRIILDKLERSLSRLQADLKLIPEGKGSASVLSINYNRGFEAARSQALLQFLKQVQTPQNIAQ
jgi:hypothetical protein